MGDIGKTISSAGTVLKEATPYVAAGAALAGAALPLFLQEDEIALPGYQPTTAQGIEAEAAQKAVQRRRELARRRGQQATIRTSPLGVTTDFGVRRPDITGV